jgi:sugar-phosphatase
MPHSAPGTLGTVTTPNPGPPPDLGSLAGRTFDAVLFDLDGTLISSLGSVARSWSRWAELEGVDPVGLRNFHGVPSAQIVAELVGPGRAAESTRLIDSLELADTEGIVALPGTLRALATLLAPVPGASRQWAAIATSCSGPLAAVRLKASGLSVPEVVVTADDVERGKPDPAPYLLAARRLGVDPARCLVVEDAPSGLRAGIAAGAATLAVRTSSGEEELAHADGVVSDLGDVEFSVGADGIRVRLTGRE